MLVDSHIASIKRQSLLFVLVELVLDSLELVAMDQKRNGVEGDDGGGCLDPEAKRRRTLLNSLREVIVMKHSVEQHLPKIEHFLRRVVQEEVQYAFWRRLDVDPRVNRLQAAVRKPYQLRFMNSLPKTIFTNKKIEAEGQKAVQIALVDSNSQIVTSGHFSSVKVEIVVLDGDFCADGQYEWLEKGFLDNIVREREGKRPLLTGELGVTLSKGIGYLGDVNFTDNSSWIRSRKFRLGAVISGENNVREAVSEAFLVKDHRGESYQKHHPPYLTDDVWRLEKIGKDGVFHKRLEDNKIKTVQDFLRNLVMDQHRLRYLLGNGMSNKTWDAIVEHAWECCMPKDLYMYNGSSGLTLLFNPIYQLVGAILNDQFYPLDKIPSTKKAFVEELKEVAYKAPDLITVFTQHLIDNSQRLHSFTTDHLTLPLPTLSSQLIGVDTSRSYRYPLDQIQQIDSFQNNSGDGCNIFSDNAEINGLVEPVRLNHPLAKLHGEAGLLCSSPFSSLFWETRDSRDDLYQVTGAVTSRRPDTHVNGRAKNHSSAKWVKLMAVSKWMGVALRSAARRASALDVHHITTFSSMYDVYAGNDLWS